MANIAQGPLMALNLEGPCGRHCRNACPFSHGPTGFVMSKLVRKCFKGTVTKCMIDLEFETLN